MARIYYRLQLYREQPIEKPRPSWPYLWEVIQMGILALILYVIACVLLGG